ncbi:MAG: ATP-binding cassette domain-containing protein [Bryobacteraceae bacterium]|nr:ATP-binding cassette domain-containing protein [Bryobacteraceae bacterium]
MTPLVAFRNVSCSIGGRPVLREVEFELMPGETLVLLGRSGSGKTTALKLVNALLLPDSGEVIVEGRATTAWDPIELRRRIGYVIQEVGLFPHLTVGANVGLVPGLLQWDRARIAARVDELLLALGLPPDAYAARYPRELSGGERQRAGVARALAADPDLLLFDEPFGALDPVTRLEAQRQFLDARTRFRKAALFVTHDIGEALAVGTRIGLLWQGRLAVMASPPDFLRSEHEEARAFRSCLDSVHE